MKIKFAGDLRADGTFPTLTINGEDIESKDGVYDVPDDAAADLVDGGNFVEPDFAEGTDKDTLIAEAKELGINATKSWGLAKLETAITEARGALVVKAESLGVEIQEDWSVAELKQAIADAEVLK